MPIVSTRYRPALADLDLAFSSPGRLVSSRPMPPQPSLCLCDKPSCTPCSLYNVSTLATTLHQHLHADIFSELPTYTRTSSHRCTHLQHIFSTSTLLPLSHTSTSVNMFQLPQQTYASQPQQVAIPPQNTLLSTSPQADQKPRKLRASCDACSRAKVCFGMKSSKTKS